MDVKINKISKEDLEVLPMSRIRDGKTMKIRPETRNRLKAAKRGGESYDDLINRLLDGVGDAV